MESVRSKLLIQTTAEVLLNKKQTRKFSRKKFCFDLWFTHHLYIFADFLSSDWLNDFGHRELFKAGFPQCARAVRCDQNFLKYLKGRNFGGKKFAKFNFLGHPPDFWMLTLTLMLLTKLLTMNKIKIIIVNILTYKNMSNKIFEPEKGFPRHDFVAKQSLW